MTWHKQPVKAVIKTFGYNNVPGEYSYGGEISYDNNSRFHNGSYEHENFASRAIYDSNLKSPYGEKKQVEVQVFDLSYKDGKPESTLYKTYTITLPEGLPSEEQFTAAQDKILSGVPEEFRSFISTKSWEDGHSAGYSEVLMCCQDLVDELRPCIEEYKKTIAEKSKYD